MNTKTTVMNQDWVPCSTSNSSRHPQDIWWKCRDRVNHVWNFIDGNDTSKVDGCYMTKAANKTVVNLCLLPLKARMHISYIENESKHRAFSEPKFYPEFWVIAMGIGKAGSKVILKTNQCTGPGFLKTVNYWVHKRFPKLNFMRIMHHVQTNP